MTSIESYFNKLKEKIQEKELDNFWLFIDKSEFKPIKNVTKKDIQKKLKKDVEKYSGKKIAQVSLVFKPKISFKKLKNNDIIFTIKIFIFKINENGDIDYDTDSEWELVINYNVTELNNNHFTLKELNKMILASSKLKILSDISGIPYTNWLNFNKHKSK